MKYILTSICLTLLMSCCGTKETTTNNVAEQASSVPVKGSFKVTEVTGVDLGMIEPTIIADAENQKLRGYAGCNQYTATYKMTATSFMIEDISKTKMACVHGMEEEQKFTNAMAKVNRHTLKNGVLMLYDDANLLIKAESNIM